MSQLSSVKYTVHIYIFDYEAPQLEFLRLCGEPPKDNELNINLSSIAKWAAITFTRYNMCQKCFEHPRVALTLLAKIKNVTT